MNHAQGRKSHLTDGQTRQENVTRGSESDRTRRMHASNKSDAFLWRQARPSRPLIGWLKRRCFSLFCMHLGTSDKTRCTTQERGASAMSSWLGLHKKLAEKGILGRHSTNSIRNLAENIRNPCFFLCFRTLEKLIQKNKAVFRTLFQPPTCRE